MSSPLRPVPFALLALCLAASTPGCKKSAPHVALPIADIPVAQSSAQTNMPAEASLAVADQNTLRLVGRYIDDCPPSSHPRCTAEFRFTPSAAAALTMPPPPKGDTVYLASADGRAFVDSRRKSLADLVAGMRDWVAADEAARADAGSTASATLVTVIPASSPARIGYEVLYTATRAGFSAVRFLVQTPTGWAVLTPSMPTGAVRPVVTTPLLTLEDNGISLQTPAGNVSSGCDDLGPGTAVPNTPEGKADFAGLTACAVKTLARSPELGNTIEVRPTLQTPFQTLVSAVDSVQRKPDGTPLFTDIRFQAAKPASAPPTASAASGSAAPATSQ